MGKFKGTEVVITGLGHKFKMFNAEDESINVKCIYCGLVGRHRLDKGGFHVWTFDLKKAHVNCAELCIKDILE